MIYDVIVIGGGASGMMSAIKSAENGANVLLLEHNEKLGKKLYITGKGRCNITNNSSVENCLNNVVTNKKFLFSAFNKFSPQDTMEFFSSLGLKLKTERGNRVFPASDKSSDVIKCLEQRLRKLGVKMELNCNILEVSKTNNLFNIKCANHMTYTSNSLVVATGGLSYSGTGATGFGYELAKKFGHKIIAPKSALCPIIVKEDVSSLNGLSLKNVELSVDINNKPVSCFGEMLFTYTSLTGPIALSLSSKINSLDIKNKKVYIDFKPALNVNQLEDKFKREFLENAKKDLKNYLHSLLPAKIIDCFMLKCGLANKKVADLTKEDRTKLINGIKKFDFCIKSLDNINVSIVTSGGVDVRDIDPKSCQSKLVKNLYFVGEVLDVDALTGGFNLQIAWATGVLAGQDAAKQTTKN